MIAIIILIIIIIILIIIIVIVRRNVGQLLHTIQYQIHDVGEALLVW
jgi:predicted Holliday junction resolvase-like endonuclease